MALVRSPWTGVTILARQNLYGRRHVDARALQEALGDLGSPGRREGTTGGEMVGQEQDMAEKGTGADSCGQTHSNPSY